MESIPTVCYSTGTMNSLVEKLAKMENHSKSTQEFSELTQEFKKAVLSLMEDYLDKLAVPKVCMKQVRELVFEIEDWIDQKPETSMLLDPSDKKEIKNFMTEIAEARERFIWYDKLLKILPTDPDLAAVAPSNITIKPQLFAKEKSCQGDGPRDEPRDELIKHLTDDKEDMRKVVSVVGMEGLGKTTLAKEIYSELQLRGQFQCQAFVSVSRRQSAKEILTSILRQVKPKATSLELEASEQEVISELRQYLDMKRYFVLIDGIWSKWAWKVINCALPNNSGSRVLTTTCIMDVGRSCCSYPTDLVYQMEALSKENSRILFLSRTITLKEEEKWDGFEDDLDDMLEMCGGMPLAMNVAASLLLSSKSKALAEWRMTGKSIQYSISEWMTKILQMSYADLSLPLRSCFLYLCVFPENYAITKDHLIWLWGAEGFIPKTGEDCLWVTGERYFNELISRRLIQPVFTCDDDQAVGCTVHTVILDFVRSMSREENFATRATELNSSPFPCDTIRRFSLDCGKEDEVGTLSTKSVHLSSMRSLTVFGKLDPPPVNTTVKQRAPARHADEERASDRHRQRRWPFGSMLAFDPRVRMRRPSDMRPLTVTDAEEKLDPPDSPSDEEWMSDPQSLAWASKHGAEEIHASKDPRVRMTPRQSDMRPLTVADAEEKLDPPDSPSHDEWMPDPQSLAWASMHGAEEIPLPPRARMMPPATASSYEGKIDSPDSPSGGDERISGPPAGFLSAFKLLRVLDLEHTKNLENKHLEGIGGFALLRYLGLAGTGITQLPEDIGRLEQLETLDVRRINWNNKLWPPASSSLKLHKLRNLLVEDFSHGFWDMPELEVASRIRVDGRSSIDRVEKLLKKCEQLRMLGLNLKVENPVPDNLPDDLVSFLNEVVKSKLQCLSISFRDAEHYKGIPLLLDSWERVTAPLAKKFEIQRFELRLVNKIVSVPPKLGSLESLTHLHISLGRTTKAKDLLVLGGLTNLVLLHVAVEKFSEGERPIIKGGIFPCLKVFSLGIQDCWTRLEFEEGAMPQLQTLGRILRVSKRWNQAYPDIGIEHLTCLARLHATFNCRDATVSQVEAAEAAIRGHISNIATKPTLEFSRTNETDMIL
uniref:Uncharacterized protein n=1 Tax=Avena sativa TaxID=4498 RepID=A0ACD5ZG95_AVESA